MKALRAVGINTGGPSWKKNRDFQGLQDYLCFTSALQGQHEGEKASITLGRKSSEPCRAVSRSKTEQRQQKKRWNKKTTKTNTKQNLTKRGAEELEI